MSHTKARVLPLLVLVGAATGWARGVHADPLTLPPPVNINGGPLGTLSAQGIVSGMWSDSSAPNGSNPRNRFEASNAFVILQKTTGELQFYVQAGAYAFPSVGVPRATTTTYTNLFGPVPEAYLKLVPNSEWSFEAGKLATMIGQESTYTYLNFNIQRGLVWNDMENAVSRGVQANYANGPVSAALQVSDGFYSKNYGAVEAMVGYSLSPTNTVSFVALVPDRNTPSNPTSTDANAQLYNLMWTYSTGPWVLAPYLIAMDSPASSSAGFTGSAHASGAVFLASYSFTKRWSLGSRLEYATSSGDAGSANSNILGYGPDSKAWTLTFTPTYQDQGFFARAEASYVRAVDFAPGSAFGSLGTNANQFRIAMETGLMF